MAHWAPDSPPPFLNSELLCFIQNKLDVMTFETLVKTCSEFYSSEKIQEANDLLWKSVLNVFHKDRKDLRNIKRKNTGTNSKARTDCEDVVKAMQVCDKEGTPMPKFYAIDLGSVPSSSSSLDITVLLGQFSEIQAEMKEMKDAMKTLQATVPKVNQTNQDPERTWASVTTDGLTTKSATVNTRQ